MHNKDKILNLSTDNPKHLEQYANVMKIELKYAAMLLEMHKFCINNK